MKNADRRGPTAEPQEPVRLQKALAEAGLGSRREIEGWIREGRVRVNGELAKLGDRVLPSDRVRVDGQEVRRRGPKRHSVRVLAYHKPEGEVVTRKDPEGRPTIFRRLPGIRDGRWITVGRLDLNTAGLLLVTNHGELANRLMHPSRALEREYAVRVRGVVSDQVLAQLVNGVELDDGPARFEEIVPSGGSESHQWFHVLIVEGRNREVRRLWEAVGCTVSRLKRVRFGNVILGARPTPGQWREVIGEELDTLMALAELGQPATARAEAGAGAVAGAGGGSGTRVRAGDRAGAGVRADGRTGAGGAASATGAGGQGRPSKPRAGGPARTAGRRLKPRFSGRR